MGVLVTMGNIMVMGTSLFSHHGQHGDGRGPTATSTSAATTAATTVAQGLRCELLRQRLVLHRAETRRGSGYRFARCEYHSPAARRASL